MDQPISPDQSKQLIRHKVPLAGLTTIGIGGSADYFAEVNSTASLAHGVAWARDRGLPLLVLGGGSNVIIADSGFPGLVLLNRISGVQTAIASDEVMITAGSGENWDSLVSMTVEREWAGLECLSGIPGSVGATPIQNVGAYGQEVSETIVSVSALDLRTGEMVVFGPDECEFGYRTSRFKTSDLNHYIITSVVYRLRASGKPAARYQELQLRLREAGLADPSLADVRAAVLALRRGKGMVIDPDDDDSRSVGSFFINPIVTQEELETIRAQATRQGVPGRDMPSFPVADRRIKLSAAWLIERAGFERGYLSGKVGISRKHSLAIVNRGGATAREVIELADRIRSRVHETFGVVLEPEPVLVGF